jgi:magnesium-transporting ATPase (P-type)
MSTGKDSIITMETFSQPLLNENSDFRPSALSARDPSGHSKNSNSNHLTSGETRNERTGLTSEEVENLLKQYGFNELPVIEIPLWKVFLQQFMGTMPYMLELAIIIAAATEDWTDFGIILAMVISFNIF